MSKNTKRTRNVETETQNVAEQPKAETRRPYDFREVCAAIAATFCAPFMARGITKMPLISISESGELQVTDFIGIAQEVANENGVDFDLSKTPYSYETRAIRHLLSMLVTGKLQEAIAQFGDHGQKRFWDRNAKKEAQRAPNIFEIVKPLAAALMRLPEVKELPKWTDASSSAPEPFETLRTSPFGRNLDLLDENVEGSNQGNALLSVLSSLALSTDGISGRTALFSISARMEMMIADATEAFSQRRGVEEAKFTNRNEFKAFVNKFADGLLDSAETFLGKTGSRAFRNELYAARNTIVAHFIGDLPMGYETAEGIKALEIVEKADQAALQITVGDKTWFSFRTDREGLTRGKFSKDSFFQKGAFQVTEKLVPPDNLKGAELLTAASEKVFTVAFGKGSDRKEFKLKAAELGDKVKVEVRHSPKYFDWKSLVKGESKPAPVSVPVQKTETKPVAPVPVAEVVQVVEKKEEPNLLNYLFGLSGSAPKPVVKENGPASPVMKEAFSDARRRR
ncbi:MAG: hypothetical protein WC471_03710 [Candidatus Woesearchaeota archaeon]